MYGPGANLRRACAIGSSALFLWLGGCASREVVAPAAQPSAAPPSGETAPSADAPVSLSAEVDRAPLPVVPVAPSDLQGSGVKPELAIVGAEQQSRIEPVRRRPAPLLFGLLTGHEPFLGEVDPGRRRGVTYKIARTNGIATDAQPATREEIERQAMPLLGATVPSVGRPIEHCPELTLHDRSLDPGVPVERAVRQ